MVQNKNIAELTEELHAINPIFKKISEGKDLSFEEAWMLVNFYKQNEDDQAFDYVKQTPQSEYPQLLEDVKLLQKETNALLQLYYKNIPEFAYLNKKGFYDAISKVLSSIRNKTALKDTAASLKEFFDVDKYRDYETEHRKNSSLLRFKLSSLVMLISHIDTVARALIEDLSNYQQKK